MRTKITIDGYVIIPRKIRKPLHVGPDTGLEWVVEGATARVIPVLVDPVRAFRGSRKKGMAEQLLKERRLGRQRENASYE
jgi:bifunctional DNA-binding transcriptional regulator/antitoxin component of YhaV-PrlF toxin-antitoxin module